MTTDKEDFKITPKKMEFRMNLDEDIVHCKFTNSIGETAEAKVTYKNLMDFIGEVIHEKKFKK